MRERDGLFEEAQSTTEESEVTINPIKTPPPSPLDVQLTANEIRYMLQIVQHGSTADIPFFVKRQLQSLDLITPLYKDPLMWDLHRKRQAVYVGEVLTTAGRWWAFHAGIAPEPS